jgi:hypothetical protein
LGAKSWGIPIRWSSSIEDFGIHAATDDGGNFFYRRVRRGTRRATWGFGLQPGFQGEPRLGAKPEPISGALRLGTDGLAAGAAAMEASEQAALTQGCGLM